MTNQTELRFKAFWNENGPDLAPALTLGTDRIWDLTGPNPTDEDCAFCDQPESTESINAFDIAIPIAGGKIALKGALGMLRPGYMLGVTRDHITSFAQLSKSILATVDEAFKACEDRLRQNLPYNEYVRLEHGSDNISSCGLGAGACVTHAHQQLIPGKGGLAERMLAKGPEWTHLNNYSDLADVRGEPYLYVGSEAGHYVATNPQVPSQWGRRIVAHEDGHDNWDWALVDGGINLLQTFLAFGFFPQGRLVVSTSQDRATFSPRRQPRGGGLYK